jgi:hypothetical protein
MEFLEANEKLLHQKTLKEFYEEVKKRTDKSQVQVFGNHEIASQTID